MAVTGDFYSVCGGGDYALVWGRCHPTLCPTWADRYASSSFLSNTQADEHHIMYAWRSTGGPTYSKCAIARGGIAFDTSVIPAAATINSARILGDIAYVGHAVMDAYCTHLTGSVGFYRFPGLVNGCAWFDTSNFLLIKDCVVLMAFTWVSPEETTYKAFVANLTEQGLAAIIKEGTTKFAIKTNFDTLTPMTNNTYFGAKFQSLKLEVTYVPSGEELVVVTLPATGITKTSAVLNGEIASGTATKRGFDWGVSTAMDNEWYESGTYAIGDFDHEVTGLTEGTEYCFRAKAEE